MGKRLSKIYTRTGDDGSTGLGDGTRLPKSDLRFELIGTIDEVNCWLGMLTAEISEDDAKTLIKNGCIAVAEGANMPTMQAGVDVYQRAKIMYAPSKAANAGGVAV